MVGVGAVDRMEATPRKGWQSLQNFRKSHADWVMGHISFEMKESQYGAGVPRPNLAGFPALHFFQPETVLVLRGGSLEIGIFSPGDPMEARARSEAILEEIRNVNPPPAPPGPQPLPQALLQPGADPRAILWERRLDREAYLRQVTAIQDHLRRGDAYEVNFCNEHFAAGLQPDPVRLFTSLQRLSPAPFAALYRLEDRFLVSSSPERFLQKIGEQLITQPMKGTMHRGKDSDEDAALSARLRFSRKERSENIMAVDLVRSDLSRVAVPGSVEVVELCGIYTFPQVHQLVSTVRARMAPDASAEEVLEAAFPMGSMTGAPKHRVLQLIDRYERSARGIYSGALGYFTPEGDFDFNVVIRSIACDHRNKTVSIQTGSGITVYSDPAAEWEECLLKGHALKHAVAESIL